MARQYDAMVKPRLFNIGDLVLKKVSLATKNPAHGKLGPNWEGPYKVINCKRQESYGILWAYRTTVRNPTGETPFKLAYGSEAIIPVKVHMANHRVMKYQDEDNEEQLRLNLDLIDKLRMDVEQRTARYKNLMARQYNAMVKPRHFNIEVLVL